jgi:hypothetical protein
LSINPSTLITGKIEIFDSQGRLIISRLLNDFNHGHEYQINVEKIGTYMVRVSKASFMESRKWIVVD